MEPRDIRQIETQVAQAFKTVLRTVANGADGYDRDIGSRDDFFYLGGQSLQALSLAAEINTRLGTALTLRDVFEAPSVHELALRVIGSLNSSPSDFPEDARKHSQWDDSSFPASGTQAKYLKQARDDSDAMRFKWDVSELSIKGPVNMDLLENALALVVQRHEALRTTFHWRDGSPVGVVGGADGFSIRRDDLSEHPLEEQKRLLAAAVDSEFATAGNPSSDLMIRARFITLGEASCRVVLAVNHLALDPWSVALLYRDWAHAYVCLQKGHPVDFKPIGRQYSEFARAEARLLDSPTFHREVDYWSRRLQSPLPTIRLPGRNAFADEGDDAAAYVSVVVPARQREQLHAIIKSVGVSEFMALLGIFVGTVWQLTDESDIPIRCVMSKRDDVDLMNTMGVFINTSILRFTVNPALPYTDLLQSVRGVVMGAQAHNAVPFEKIAAAVGVGSGLGIPLQFWAPDDTGGNDAVAMPDVPSLSIEHRVHERANAHTTGYEVGIETRMSDNLELAARYRTGFYGREDIERLLIHYSANLSAVLDSPAAPIRTWPVPPG